MEKEATPIEATPSTEVNDAQKIWQEYLQKSCEVGQLDHALEQIDRQRTDIEKKLDITKRQRNTAALEHNRVQKELAAKVQMPKAAETAEAH